MKKLLCVTLSIALILSVFCMPVSAASRDAYFLGPKNVSVPASSGTLAASNLWQFDDGTVTGTTAFEGTYTIPTDATAGKTGYVGLTYKKSSGGKERVKFYFEVDTNGNVIFKAIVDEANAAGTAAVSTEYSSPITYAKGEPIKVRVETNATTCEYKYIVNDVEVKSGTFYNNDDVAYLMRVRYVIAAEGVTVPFAISNAYLYKKIESAEVRDELFKGPFNKDSVPVSSGSTADNKFFVFDDGTMTGPAAFEGTYTIPTDATAGKTGYIGLTYKKTSAAERVKFYFEVDTNGNVIFKAIVDEANAAGTAAVSAEYSSPITYAKGEPIKVRVETNATTCEYKYIVNDVEVKSGTFYNNDDVAYLMRVRYVIAGTGVTVPFAISNANLYKCVEVVEEPALEDELFKGPYKNDSSPLGNGESTAGKDIWKFDDGTVTGPTAFEGSFTIPTDAQEGKTACVTLSYKKADVSGSQEPVKFYFNVDASGNVIFNALVDETNSSGIAVANTYPSAVTYAKGEPIKVRVETNATTCEYKYIVNDVEVKSGTIHDGGKMGYLMRVRYLIAADVNVSFAMSNANLYKCVEASEDTLEFDVFKLVDATGADLSATVNAGDTVKAKVSGTNKTDIEKVVVILCEYTNNNGVLRLEQATFKELTGEDFADADDIVLTAENTNSVYKVFAWDGFANLLPLVDVVSNQAQ